jgi:uncharacterized protein involved in cysteine biosynthesis
LAVLFPLQALALSNVRCSVDPTTMEKVDCSLPSWAAWLIAFFITLVEILLSLLITYAVCLPEFMDRVHLKTLEIEGIVIANKPGCCSQCASDSWRNLFLIMLFILTLPLHFIPIAGTVAACFINGALQAWFAQEPYFNAFGITWQQQWNEWVAPNKHEYLMFGFSAHLLQLIPLVNFVTMFTNYVASAIWCANEHKRRSKAGRELLIRQCFKMDTESDRQPLALATSAEFDKV